MLVEDDAGMNQAIERLLNAAGFRAVTFSSAEALLQAGAAATAACLVLDINLPGLSGFELHRRLAMSCTPPPVIFITAYDEETSRRDAIQAGASGYLTKPFSGRSLVLAITKAVEREGSAKGEISNFVPAGGRSDQTPKS